MNGAIRDGLDVRVYGIRVGGLQRDAHGTVRFTPDRTWLEGGQHPVLGLAMLTSPRVRAATAGLPEWFENLLPEPDSALRRWLCRGLGLEDRDSPGLLAALGADLPGAVEVGGTLGTTEHLPDPDARGPEPQSSGSSQLSMLRFSLAGLQLKLSMHQAGDRFVLPARGDTGRWILKVPGPRFDELPEVEAATMTWAGATGLTVPRFVVQPRDAIEGVDPALLVGVERVFAIERFDRSVDGRVHQEDLAQVLEIRPEHKYGDSGPRKIGYDGVARLVADACGAAAGVEFVDRLAFVVASGNDDAHLKNWSLQWGHEHRPWLSPCYDMVSTIAWPTELHGWTAPDGPTMALALGRVRRFASLDRAALRRFAQRSGIADAEGRFIAALERSRDAWPSVVDSAVARMRKALVDHWQRVPLLRELGGWPAA